MKHKNYIFSISVVLLIVATFIIGPVFLIAHEFDNISDASPLKYFVDSEIRNLPILYGGTHITYKSYPVDGTAKSINAVRLVVEDRDRAYTQTASYFLKLGYRQLGRDEFSRDGDEIMIEYLGGYFEVTKLSWD